MDLENFFNTPKGKEMGVSMRTMDAKLLGLLHKGDGQIIVDNCPRGEWEEVVNICLVNYREWIGDDQIENVLTILEATN